MWAKERLLRLLLLSSFVSFGAVVAAAAVASAAAAAAAAAATAQRTLNHGHSRRPARLFIPWLKVLPASSVLLFGFAANLPVPAATAATRPSKAAPQGPDLRESSLISRWE